ncbi:hypothetical protein BOTBODRAFT_71032 [Botryobasidium botryosum FD-172 SS1]|uniref:WW domain-containing protein n=1 Tax=Botryobasidium botryosum (strain FD-172 SS1) TaxID=930990 RepID=A0A067M407_BOTB1|nr:hypothetical protein BOTBODRAFT_71032 [Botryobasidium botryosum FD-172 SS1]
MSSPAPSPSRPASPSAPAVEEKSDSSPPNAAPDHAESTDDKEVEATAAPTTDAEPSKDEEQPKKDSPPSNSEETAPLTIEWQAVWAPTHNAYYYFNTRTNETTWSNPLAPADSSSTDAPTSAAAQSQQPLAASQPLASTSTSAARFDPAALNGIDPSLAHLDPTLASPLNPSGAYTYSAKFNARTGAFARTDARDPSHLSEYERAKRMSDVYFDVGAWEAEVDARNAAEAESEGKKRKKPTKADLERFKEQKKRKKLSKTAWLRN